jgi:hypothetical protein
MRPNFSRCWRKRLIEPSWTVITQNQSLKTFKESFEKFWKKKYKEDIVLAISHEDKRPDFTLVAIDGLLHIVEIKRAEHDLDDADLKRLLNYVDAFEEFFDTNKELAKNFHRGWRIDLVADGEKIKDVVNKRAFKAVKDSESVVRITWHDFLDKARKVHEEFLKIHDYSGAVRKRAKGKSASDR